MSIVQVFVKNRAKILLFANTFFVLLTGLFYLIALLLKQEVFFAPLYFVLPFLWFAWVVSIGYCSSKSDIKNIVLNWALISLSLLLLLLLSSLTTENIYNSRGADVVMFISNLPIMLPFGGVLWYFMDHFLSSNGIPIRALPIEGYFKLWIEMLIVSVLQGAVIFILKKLCKVIISGRKNYGSLNKY